MNDYRNLDNYTNIDFWHDEIPDLHGALARLRANHTHVWTRSSGETPALMLLSEELVVDAFRDEATFPASGFTDLSNRALGRTIRIMTGEEHRINRALVAPAFRRSLMANYRSELLEPLAHELIDSFCGDGEADLVKEFNIQMPLLVTMRLLGLPEDLGTQAQQWAYDLFSYPGNPDVAMRAAHEFTEMVRPILAKRRTAPSNDLLSTLATTRVDGKQLEDEEIFSFIRLLFPAGVDTTYHSLGIVLAALLTHPDQLDLVRHDLNEVPWAIEEALRWEPSVSLQKRYVAEPVKWNGIDIPADTWILLSLTAAGRDPEVYADPHRFDITRRSGAAATFGAGPHYCLGAFLAQEQMRTSLRALIQRLSNLELIDPADARIGSRMGNGLRGPARLRTRFLPSDPQAGHGRSLDL